MVIWNAFLSGLLYFFYLIVDGWFWIFAIAGLIVMAIVENKEINSDYVEDDRHVL